MPDEVVRLLGSLLVFALQGSILAFFIVMAILDHRAFKRHWKTGLAVGILCLLMMVPDAVFSVAYFDLSVLEERTGLPFRASRFAGVLLLAASLGGGFLFLVTSGWYMIVYYVAAAEWEKVKQDALPLLRRMGRPPWAWILAASAFGIAAGILSEFLFRAAGIEEGEAMKQFREFFPGATEASLIIRVPITLLAVSAPAIVEELVFRGGMLGLLLRWSGKNGAAIAGSIVAVSLVWALMHILNTDAPLVKCAQIFVIGLFLGEFARRSCIEAAMAGHLCLNVAATVAAFAAFPDV